MGNFSVLVVDSGLSMVVELSPTFVVDEGVSGGNTHSTELFPRGSISLLESFESSTGVPR